MFFVLFLTATLMALGAITFKRFEERTSPLRGILKLVVLLGTTALITYFFGELWGIAWAIGAFALGTIFHFWWTLKHGINPFTAEPRARYYELRGWQL
jgi:hypothetical protein